MSKVVKGIGHAISKIKPLKLIGGLAKGASKIAGFVPGVGTLAGAALGAGGGLLSGEGFKGALKGAATGALPGLGKTILGKVAGGNLLSKATQFLGGKGLPGSKGSLIGQLATAVPGVIGAIQSSKAQGRANRALQTTTDTANSLLREGQPLRTGANAAILERLNAGGPDLSFASDRLNPFTQGFDPAAQAAAAEQRRKRRLAMAGGLPPGIVSTPYMDAATQAA